MTTEFCHIVQFFSSGMVCLVRGRVECLLLLLCDFLIWFTSLHWNSAIPYLSLSFFPEMLAKTEWEPEWTETPCLYLFMISKWFMFSYPSVNHPSSKKRGSVFFLSMFCICKNIHRGSGQIRKTHGEITWLSWRSRL